MKMIKKATAVALAATMLAGCGGSSSGDKIFNFASELDIQGLDTSVVDDGMSFTAVHAFTEGLEGVNKDRETVGAIAESYEVSKDNKTYTFKLRDDAKWSNGDDVTANDFVYAWQRIIKNAGTYSYMYGSEGAQIKNADKLIALGSKATQKQLDTLGATAKDDKTLVVELTTPVPYFVQLMTFPCYYPINQKFAEEAGKNYGTAPEYVLSNGAFKLTKWTKGKSADFEKNEDYYDADSVKVSGLHYDLALKSSTVSANFDSGVTNYGIISTELVDKYKDKDTYKSFREGFLYYLQPNFENKYMANENIRKAISTVINREKLCSDVLKDGSTAATGFVPRELSQSPDGKDFRDIAKSYVEEDTKKAQEYFDAGLKELGESSITVELLYGTDESPMDTVAEWLQGQLTQLKGLNIKMKATTKQDRIYTRQKGGKFELCLTRWGPDYSDPTTYLNLLNNGNANNYGHYNNAKYNSLMKQIQNETDTSKRYDLMVQAEEVAMAELGDIPLFEKGGSALQSTDVDGIITMPVGVPYIFTYVEFK